MKEKVLQVIQAECPDVDFLSSNTLVDDGILDSLVLTSIIAALSIEFNITIPYEEIVEANFNSIDALTALVERLQK